MLILWVYALISAVDLVMELNDMMSSVPSLKSSRVLRRLSLGRSQAAASKSVAEVWQTIQGTWVGWLRPPRQLTSVQINSSNQKISVEHNSVFVDGLISAEELKEITIDDTTCELPRWFGRLSFMCILAQVYHGGNGMSI